jgi:hypothetical protein
MAAQISKTSVFNSILKKRQRIWARLHSDFEKAQLLKNEVEERLLDCVRVLNFSN